MSDPYRKPYRFVKEKQTPEIDHVYETRLQRWKDQRFYYWTGTIAGLFSLILIAYIATQCAKHAVLAIIPIMLFVMQSNHGKRPIKI